MIDNQQNLTKIFEISAVNLRGDYVSLDPVSLNGLQDFHFYSMYPELYRYFEFSPFETLDESRQYLKKLILRSASPETQYWFIRLSEGERIVGSIGLHSLDLRRGSVEIGYGVSPEFWGRGIFSAAAAIMIDHAFNQLCLHRIVARTSLHNVASIRGLEKLGFKAEGVMRDYYKNTRGEWFDAVLLSRLSSDK